MSYLENHILGKDTRLEKLLFLILSLFLTFKWLVVTKYIDLKIAWGGFSPIFWIYKSANPENFIKDFPSGIELYDNSAFMYVYKLFYNVFGVAPETLLPIIIAFEIVILSYAIYYLTRAIFPEASPWIPFLAIFFTFGSNTWNISISNFGVPFLAGQFYNVADALGIFAISMAIRGKLMLTSLLLAITFIIHPIVGMLFIAFVAGLYLLFPKQIMNRKGIIGIIVFLVPIISWSLIMVGQTGINGILGDKIPLQLWFDLTRMCNYHWYPVAAGYFTDKHTYVLIPLLSFILLLTFYITRKPLREIERKILMGMGVVLSLTLVGIIFSVIPFSPALVKLSLHRAQRLIIIVGLIYVIKGLWEDINFSNIWRSLTAIFVLFSPFVFFGYPIFLSFILCIPAYIGSYLKKKINWGNLTVTILTIFILLLLCIYKFVGISPDIRESAYTGINVLTGMNPLIKINFLTILLSAFILSNIIFIMYGKKTASFVIFSFMIFLMISFNVQGDQISPTDISLYRSYKEAQLWARDKTPPTSLFMVDPTIYYGWRDYSQRSSFGNLREWIHTGWLYNSDFQVYQDGLARLREFSIDINQYTQFNPPLEGFNHLHVDVSEKYYSADDAWRLALAKSYDINYFLFIKEKMVKSSSFPISYQNNYFVICAVPQK